MSKINENDKVFTTIKMLQNNGILSSNTKCYMSVMVIWKSLHEREIKKEMIYTIGAVPSARVKSIEACWLTLEPTANKSAAMWYFRKK